MKEFVNRLRNVAANEYGRKISNYDHADQIVNIANDLEAYKYPSEMTQQEYDDIQALSDIAKRNGVLGDGLDHDLVKASQDVQRLIMLRVGSRHWVQVQENKSF